METDSCPGLMMFLFEAECLGGWTSLWAPCRSETWSSGTFTAPVMATEASGVKPLGTLDADLVSRSNLCSLRWHMDRRECMEAVTERLVWLLYPKFVHYSCTMAVLRTVRAQHSAKRMRLHGAIALLSYTWL
eukprot:2467642-Amphidinium_carterae.1